MIKWTKVEESKRGYIEEYYSDCGFLVKYKCPTSWRIWCEYGQEIGLGDTKVRNIKYEDQADLIAEALKRIRDSGDYIV